MMHGLAGPRRQSGAARGWQRKRARRRPDRALTVWRALCGAPVAVAVQQAAPKKKKVVKKKAAPKKKKVVKKKAAPKKVSDGRMWERR